jgi:hypothetical protein
MRLRRIGPSLFARSFSAARWIVPIFVLPRLLTDLWRARHEIAAAEIVVVYDGGGFGHQICGPDILRRVFPGRRVVVLFGAFPGEDNWHVPLLWREPRVIFLSFALALPAGWRNRAVRVPLWLQLSFCRTLAQLLARGFPDKKIIPSSDHVIGELWREAECAGIAIHAHRVGEKVEWALPYFQLMRLRPAPAIRLQAQKRELISRRLSEHGATRLQQSPSGLCCLYLRAKGAEIEVETSSRSGSEVTEYVPAIRRLVDSGYLCLLIGDRALSGDIAASFRGWLLDAGSLDVDAGLFSLFAATEADIFIGESGGGSLPPGINGIPTLTVNHFPYYVTRLCATVFPKFCYDAAGNVISPEVMFGANSHRHAIPGGIVRSNSAEELEIAVEEFIRLHRRGIPDGVVVDDLVGTPNSLWYADAESRLSPAWLTLARQRQEGYSAIVQ